MSKIVLCFKPIPRVVKKWKDHESLTRLVFDGSNFVVQIGDDLNGYRSLKGKDAVNLLGSIYVTEPKEVEEGKLIGWIQSKTGKMVETDVTHSIPKEL